MLPRQSSHAEAIGPGCAGGPLSHPTPPSAEPARHGPAAHAPDAGGAALAVDPAALGTAGNRQHTQTPYVTGTSVLGLTFAGGVLLAADTLGSYGSTKRYKSFERLLKVNDAVVVAAGGELSDFQYIARLLEELADEDFRLDDGHALTPSAAFAYLCRVLYNRRCKMDPLWNSLAVAGVDAATGRPFLGTVGMLGTSYEDGHVATGFGNQLARPLMRARHSPEMSEADARALLRDCLRVLYYRDKQTMNKFQIAKVTSAGVEISEPFALDTKWDYAGFVDPSRAAVGTW